MNSLQLIIRFFFKSINSTVVNVTYKEAPFSFVTDNSKSLTKILQMSNSILIIQAGWS